MSTKNGSIKVVQTPPPPFYDPKRVNDWAWMVKYLDVAGVAKQWRSTYNIPLAAKDSFSVCLMVIDPQVTFCHPAGELFVAGKSGAGATEDTARTAEFIYRNLSVITQVAITLDTHKAFQIFHPVFWVDKDGKHPSPGTLITESDIDSDKWMVNPEVAWSLTSGSGKVNYMGLRNHGKHYVKQLTKGGRYALCIWPYHAILGGFGHCVMPTLHEAAWFHAHARSSDTCDEIKGGNPLTENYSVMQPEVRTGPMGEPIATKNAKFIEKLLNFDMVIIAGQAKSHCVAWSVDDLLTEIKSKDPSLASKVYLLEDCTSNVVIPAAGLDFSKQGDDAFARFEKEGMHIVKSTDPIWTWPDSPFAK